MKRLKLLSLAFMALMAVSCSTTREINYFQDLKPGATAPAVIDSIEITLRPKDKISIIVNAQDEKLNELFNLQNTSQNGGGSNMVQLGYTLDNAGCIHFPVLGKLKVEGMTREQISEYITEQIKDKELIKDPVVTVEFLNLGISVLGEVNSPGRYRIERDNVTILDALSQAGDLTIYGRRDNVLVMRQENGCQQVYNVNLTNAAQVCSSPVYYLQQNDVVYVTPNETKGRQSTVNGNTVRSTSFWLSLASFLMSIIVLIAK